MESSCYAVRWLVLTLKYKKGWLALFRQYGSIGYQLLYFAVRQDGTIARSFSLTPMLVGVFLVGGLLLPSMGKGDFPLYLTCPPLPESVAAGQVSLYVAKAQDPSGFVCVRVINGRSESIGHSDPPRVSLQRWEEGKPGQPGQFRDFPGAYIHPEGLDVQQGLVKWYSPPGAVLDEQTPMFQPAPSGRYRVCFRYDVRGQEERGKQEVCSEEFSLP